VLRGMFSFLIRASFLTVCLILFSDAETNPETRMKRIDEYHEFFMNGF
jgi:hypothetical protein